MSVCLGETFRSTRYDASPCIITALTFLTILPRYQLKLTEQYPFYPAPNGLFYTFCTDGLPYETYLKGTKFR